MVVTEINYKNSVGVKSVIGIGASVKIVKTAEVKVVVPKYKIDSEANSPYISALGPNFDEAATAETIKKIFKIVNERYAQAGIKVDYQLVYATILWSDDFDLSASIFGEVAP